VGLGSLDAPEGRRQGGDRPQARYLEDDGHYALWDTGGVSEAMRKRVREVAAGPASEARV